MVSISAFFLKALNGAKGSPAVATNAEWLEEIEKDVGASEKDIEKMSRLLDSVVSVTCVIIISHGSSELVSCVICHV
jgi:hypothetical protein